MIPSSVFDDEYQEPRGSDGWASSELVPRANAAYFVQPLLVPYIQLSVYEGLPTSPLVATSRYNCELTHVHFRQGMRGRVCSDRDRHMLRNQNQFVVHYTNKKWLIKFYRDHRRSVVSPFTDQATIKESLITQVDTFVCICLRRREI